MTERRRATSVEEYHAIEARLFAPPQADNAKDAKDAKDADAPKPPPFEVRASDVFITPFAKSGTTWLQQMFHALRTRGDMSFTDISGVVPWLEISPMLDIDVNAEQRANPRGFKSHARYEDLPAGARYIVSIRHPADVAYSMYKFMDGWFIEPGSIAVDDFVRGTFLKSGNYFKHLLSWWGQRDNPDVLFLVYEHMKEDLEGTIRAVAEFCDLTLDDELMSITSEHASLAFMQQYKDRFDDALLRAKTEETVLPPGSDSAKVRQGQVGERAHISDAVLQEIHAQWQEQVTAKLGFADYEALIAAT
ncbi:MAG: sulfotransferase domain-containing protein [Pseudomonadota bacterium]